ncbi:MAG: hypothetical protein ACD_2C00106G0003 [uncultured bacterium (gcode 4)]|uniref:Uncharacterized protein n=1 Tax=uncultured bacterium (gcode 4) TaxID=1234023 RepID=K2G641_9BACT|nr:MAG: hypothetical protein ACD_2C00106G0003 [uncultured bacterium (gcode 4)]
MLIFSHILKLTPNKHVDTKKQKSIYACWTNSGYSDTINFSNNLISIILFSIFHRKRFNKNGRYEQYNQMTVSILYDMMNLSYARKISQYNVLSDTDMISMRSLSKNSQHHKIFS